MSRTPQGTARRAVILGAGLVAAWAMPTAFAMAQSSSQTVAPALGNVVNPGTTDWANAARTGRADTLILGDSVVYANGHGWDQGFNIAGAKDLGLAGTGLIGYSTGTLGYGFNNYGTVTNGLDPSPSAVPAALQGYNLNATAATAGPSPVTTYGWGVGGTTLDPSAAYDWQLYTASPPTGGALGAFRRVGGAVGGYFFDTLQTAGPVATQSPAGGGLQQTVFHFDAQPTPTAPGVPQEFWFQNLTNTSVLYSRLLTPGATGTTVSSVGYGAHSARQFIQDVLDPMSPVGRSAYLSSLVQGGSGKLNVVIAEGFNDRNDFAPSVNGVGQTNTPAGFADNIHSLIATVRTDWSNAGLPASDLSFTLVGMYRDSYESTLGAPKLLRDFAQQEMAIAQADPQVSFVDLYDFAPDYDTANALGYMTDLTHPTLLGASTYSQYIMDTIAAPEPSGLGVLATASLGLLRRRGRTAANASGTGRDSSRR